MTLIGSDVAEDLDSNLEDTTIIDVETNEDEIMEEKPNPVPLDSPFRSDDDGEDDLEDTSAGEASLEDISNLEDGRMSSPTRESTSVPSLNSPPESESSRVRDLKNR